MRITQKRAAGSRRRNIALLAIALVLIIGVGGYYLVKKQQQDTLERNKIRQPSNSAKDDIVNSKDTVAPSKDLPANSTNTTTDQVPLNSDLSVKILSTAQVNNRVAATAQTNGSGTCVFLYEPGDGGKPVTQQVDVSDDGCSVSILENEFAYLGEWKLTVTYYKDGTKAETSKNVTIH